ncbi:MAG: hypothetical protein LBL35_00220 [Clostridiales bacterium]|jgi:hypothetical protein|nr:hypothetical protein [Clostridiales bacterium]
MLKNKKLIAAGGAALAIAVGIGGTFATFTIPPISGVFDPQGGILAAEARYIADDEDGFFVEPGLTKPIAVSFANTGTIPILIKVTNGPDSYDVKVTNDMAFAPSGGVSVVDADAEVGPKGTYYSRESERLFFDGALRDAIDWNSGERGYPLLDPAVKRGDPGYPSYIKNSAEREIPLEDAKVKFTSPLFEKAAEIIDIYENDYSPGYDRPIVPLFWDYVARDDSSEDSLYAWLYDNDGASYILIDGVYADADLLQLLRVDISADNRLQGARIHASSDYVASAANPAAIEEAFGKKINELNYYYDYYASTGEAPYTDDDLQELFPGYPDLGGNNFGISDPSNPPPKKFGASLAESKWEIVKAKADAILKRN